MHLDNIDFQILGHLSENSRIQWKVLGEHIHMSGQAVGNRIRRMEDEGIIKNYSIIVDEMKMGQAYTVFIIAYMKTSNHNAFIKFINEEDEIVEAHRVSGEACYHLKGKFSSQEKLNEVLEEILVHANYSMHLSIQEIKKTQVFSK